MEKLHNEPDVQKVDNNAFVHELKLFHSNRGTPFRHLPRINGREIDLYNFYYQVTSLGGLQKVVENQKWGVVAEALKLPKSCANFALGLRQIYIRFLGHYEKIYFLGEDPDSDKKHASESHGRKVQLPLLHQVPMVYNVAQHQIPDAVRVVSNLSKIYSTSTDYDKICMSLMSGLPNEQELALNVCTILSNEGNYMLHLEHAPKLVDLLIAQAGIWSTEDNSLKMLHLESWRDLKGRNMHRFWRSTLDLQNTDLVKFLGLDLGNYDPLDRLLNLENDSGSLNLEGQRVLRVALILHNLSFEKNNVPVLIANPVFIRFILLCVHSTWSNLKQIAYDTLSNVASEIKLRIEKDVCSRIMFQTVVDGILSPDRYLNIRSLDILSQLCSYEPNEDIVPSRLDFEIYEQLVSFLTVRDIMLLIYTLEALYSLSDLGRYPCDKIVCVHRCIGVLVSLLTLNINHYGSLGQKNMKVIETLIPTEYDTGHEEKSVASVPNELVAPPSPAPNRTSNADVDSETFASNWLKSTYETVPGFSVARNDIYADYVSYCSKAGRKGVVNANIFAGCVKRSFPSCGLKKVESSTGVISFSHDGLRKRATLARTCSPVPKSFTSFSMSGKVPNASQVSSKPGPKQSLSPILKAQLSAPPRSGGKTPIKRTYISNGRKCVPSHAPASNSLNLSPISNTPGSATLIKSLLANKVQHRNVRQVVPRGVSKMVIYSSEKVKSFSSRTLGTPTGVRCTRPSAFSGMRTPLQPRPFSNRGRLAITGTPRLLKAGAIPMSKLSPKIPNKTLFTSRMNGMQKNIQMEIFAQDEDSRKLSDVMYSKKTQVNCVQNNFLEDSSNDKDSISLGSDSFLSLTSKDSCKTLEKNNCATNENYPTSRLENLNENSTNESITINRQVASDRVSPSFEQNGSISCVTSNTTESSLSSVTQPNTNSPKIFSSCTTLLKSVLNNLDEKTGELSRQPRQLEKSKKAPLLNGLLDKGIAPLSTNTLLTAIVQNGDKSDVDSEIISEDTESLHSFVQSSSPVNNMSHVGSTASSIPSPDAESSSSLEPSSKTASPKSLLNSSISSVLNSSVLPATAFHSNGQNLVQLCTGETLSGKIEVQPEQNGVVRLHIESPENSNQGSDLSSISEIARTLECASKAISKTNEECNKQVPYCGTSGTAIVTTNTTTLANSSQQIVVVTPSVNQLPVQTTKFRTSQTVLKPDESNNLNSFPNINICQSPQLHKSTSETPSNASACLKRPSSDIPICLPTDSKRQCLETKTPLLEASLKIRTSVPCTVTNTSLKAKPFQDSQTFFKSSQIEHFSSTPKLTTAEAVAVPVQNIDIPSEIENKTFSGLSSANDNPSLTAPSQVPPGSLSSKLEYICEWKDCGLKFKNSGSVFLHTTSVHTPKKSDDAFCLWQGCDSNLKRRRLSLLTHLQDWHVNARVLHIQALRQKQLSQQGKTSIPLPQIPPSHPGYAADAALLAIRRHALHYVNPKELSEEKESALTKSIRLTSALILRNLVTHSALARTYLKRFEPQLAYIAMSPVESARTIAQCLSQLSQPQD